MTTGSLSMYEEIKALAKRNGGRVEDYIALAPQNDAFYAGTPGQRRIAEWFADLWHRFGYTYNVHIRRAHYQIMSQEPKIRLPDGVKIKTGDDTHTEVYINHDNCWNFLNNAAKAARYLGLIDPAALVDRRNPPPQVFLPYHPGEVYISAGSAPGDWATSLPDMPDAPAFYLGNYQGQQDYIVSLWCEKSTMNDILEPVARQFSADLITGLGELSITAVVQSFDRWQRKCEEYGRNLPIRILYISDFDAAGRSMPVAVGRKLEYFHRLNESQLDIRLFPLVLTQEQCITYRLPRTPMKATEKRAANFEARFGEGATELDALEALRPGELVNVLQRAITSYYDSTLDNRVDRARAELEQELRRITAQAHAHHADEIDAIRTEYDRITADFEARIADWRTRMADLWNKIGAELEQNAPDTNDYPIPEAREATEIPDPLYSSERDYTEQLARYKEFQGKA